MYSDRSKKQITAGVTYRSSNSAVVQVDANGIVKAIKAGKADIIVDYGGEQERVKVNVTTSSGGHGFD
ncbi:Ig-like domain-containing protein [Paenibacillus sp. WQ 127069]|uniref:Ig-like domain-containing protein n=1 Tax=Paenibacillus baimaensis TaxID=2982185 RepID=A0ABT2UDR6_9BACL|nr:Ig-like domain-containing protein [Paenibacillus sp. WQ 127069]MCU6792742.1 Ig-like domain-containing protein [Paenibacillus sp. WQ 127069]